MNKTTKQYYQVNRQTHQLDAAGKACGRLATEAALILMGKNKPTYSPQTDCGDIVEIKNADKLIFTGKKLRDRRYYHYTGYPGGLRTKKLSDVYAKDPAGLIRKVVKTMLPNNHLRPEIMKRIKFI